METNPRNAPPQAGFVRRARREARSSPFRARVGLTSARLARHG